MAGDEGGAGHKTQPSKSHHLKLWRDILRHPGLQWALLLLILFLIALFAAYESRHPGICSGPSRPRWCDHRAGRGGFR